MARSFAEKALPLRPLAEPLCNLGVESRYLPVWWRLRSAMASERPKGVPNDACPAIPECTAGQRPARRPQFQPTTVLHWSERVPSWRFQTRCRHRRKEAVWQQANAASPPHVGAYSLRGFVRGCETSGRPATGWPGIVHQLFACRRLARYSLPCFAAKLSPWGSPPPRLRRW